MKNKKTLIIIILILLVAVLITGFISYNKFLKSNQNETNNKDNKLDNSANLDFDFNELSQTLHSAIKKDNIKTFISFCHEKEKNPNKYPETEHQIIELSHNTINTVIEKLKTANSVEKGITYTWLGCEPFFITYYVSVNDINKFHSQKVFSLSYADDTDILLVNYNNQGYAFKFDYTNIISGFIESLK